MILFNNRSTILVFLRQNDKSVHSNTISTTSNRESSCRNRSIMRNLSILYTGSSNSYDQWIRKSTRNLLLEYILCIDWNSSIQHCNHNLFLWTWISQIMAHSNVICNWICDLYTSGISGTLFSITSVGTRSKNNAIRVNSDIGRMLANYNSDVYYKYRFICNDKNQYVRFSRFNHGKS